MLKTRHFLLALMILISGNLMFAQKAEINTEASTVQWNAKKLGTLHEGFIKLKSGYVELQDEKIVAGSFVADMTTISNTDLEIRLLCLLTFPPDHASG